MRFGYVALLVGSFVAGFPCTSLADPAPGKVWTPPSSKAAPSGPARAPSTPARAPRPKAAPSTPASRAETAKVLQKLRSGKAPLAITAKPVGTPTFWPPTPNASRREVLASGKQLMLRQAVRAQKMLPTTGFHSLEEVANAVSSMGPTRAAAVELLKKDNAFEFTMRTPGAIREAIAAKGFLNQHDTNTSRGYLGPGYRANVEASFLGVTREQYDKLPNSVKPKYGYIRPTKESGVTLQEASANHYGEDVFVFKPEIKDHVTIYPRDSLGGSAAGGHGRAVEPTEWHHVLQPWSQRMLLAPSLEVNANKELRMGAAPPPGFNGTRSSSYLEMQIWRPVTLKDVARFEFSNNPPSGAFLKALRDSGVKIYKQGATTEWNDDHRTSFFELPRANVIVTLAA